MRSLHDYRLRTALAAAAALALSAPVAASDCWVEIFEQPGFQGRSARIEGPAELPTMETINGQPWQSRVDSLRVGPGAIVSLYKDPYFKSERPDPLNHPDALKAWKYEDENYTDTMITLGLGQQAHHLSELGFQHEIRSMRVRCRP